MPTLPHASDLWSQAVRKTWFQRVVQFAFTRIVLGVFLGAILGGIEYLIGKYSPPASPAFHPLTAVVMVGLYVAAIAGYARGIERRPARELGREGAAAEWLVGMVVESLLLAVVVIALVVGGAYRVGRGGTMNAFVEGLLLFGPHALLEEFLFRVVIFKIAEEALGSVAAIAIQALVFGLAHGGNPGATVASTLAIAIEAGTLLAVLYMYTRRIWLVWGLHVGWNFTQGSVFGINVSGNALGEPTWLHSQATGAAWLTGGNFGVEASPLATAVCLGAAYLFWRAAKERGQVVSYRAQRERVRVMLARPRSDLSP